MDAIPDAQGILRFDVTQGRCLSVSGVSRNISAIRQDSMDAAVESMKDNLQYNGVTSDRVVPNQAYSRAVLST